MENRIMILFFMLLSLFILFSIASALLTGLRRKLRCRLPSVVWGVLFILPLLPFSFSQEISPTRLELTVDHTGSRVVSILPAEEEKTAPPPSLTVKEDGSITFTGTAAVSAASAGLPDGLFVPARLWEAASYLTAFILFLWVTLSLAHITHRVCGYAESIRYLTSRSVVCRDEKLCAVFQHAAAQVRLHRKAVLRIVEEGIHLSPCTSGFFTPTVYISHIQAQMAPDELEYIFLHELCHVKRHDFFLKMLALLSTSVHFWAPFSVEVRRQVYEDCEMGCDRMVLSCIGKKRCSRYMQTILAIAEQRLQGNVIRGELFSYAAGAKEILLRRYRNLLEEKPALSVSGKLLISSTVLVLMLLHTGFMTAVDTRPAADPLVDFSSPYLETVLREYYHLSPEEPVTMAHLDGIYSLEFSLSRKVAKNSFLTDENTLALCCLVNEGKYYLNADITGEEWAVMQQQDGLADGISPDLQYRIRSSLPMPPAKEEPVWRDYQYDCAVDLLPDVCPLTILERYLPANTADRSRFLSCYTGLDGTVSALEDYVTEIYMTVVREYALDVASTEEEIGTAFAQYCQEHGIPFDPADEDILGQLRQHKREEILALSPAALFQPMAFLDPAIPEEETAELIQLLQAAGKLDSKCVSDIYPDATGRYALDLADLVLFGNLRTVILNDRLVMSDTTPLTDIWCAVIER